MLNIEKLSDVLSRIPVKAEKARHIFIEVVVIYKVHGVMYNRRQSHTARRICKRPFSWENLTKILNIKSGLSVHDWTNKFNEIHELNTLQYIRTVAPKRLDNQ